MYPRLRQRMEQSLNRISLMLVFRQAAKGQRSTTPGVADFCANCIVSNKLLFQPDRLRPAFGVNLPGKPERPNPDSERFLRYSPLSRSKFLDCLHAVFFSSTRQTIPGRLWRLLLITRREMTTPNYGQRRANPDGELACRDLIDSRLRHWF